MRKDPQQILSLLDTRDTLNLFPIENRMSPNALAALGTDAVHRYPASEGPDYFFGDPQELAEVYDACVEAAKAYFGATYAFVPLLSGLHAMHSVMTALCAAGDRVLVLDPEGGGHYATGTICAGYGYDYGYLPFDRETCLIDLSALEREVELRPPHLVYLDASTTLRLPRIADLRRTLGAEPLLCLDASHIFGILPAAPEGTGLDAGLSSCSGSTHKSLPGPQKALFLTNDDTVAERLQARLPFVVSSGHSASVAALAITLEELYPVRREYAAQVRANARAFAAELDARGFDVAGKAFGFTETHQVWIAPPSDVPGKEWGKKLCDAWVRSTTVPLPTNRRSGLRLGVQELTRLGMEEAEMASVADLLTRVLLWDERPTDVRRDVVELARSFSEVRFVGEPSVQRSRVDVTSSLAS